MDSFICEICHEEFNNFEHFSQHKNALGCYGCGMCEAMFHSETEMQQHKDGVHLSTDTTVLPKESADHESPIVVIDPILESSQDIGRTMEMIDIGENPQLPTAITVPASPMPDDQLGNVELLSCPDGNVHLLSNVKVASHEFCSQDFVLASLPTVNEEKILPINSDERDKACITSCDFLEAPSASEILEPQNSLLEEPLVCDKNGDSVNSESGFSSLPANKDIPQISGIYACILCQSFAFSKSDIVSHLNTTHKDSVAANNIDPEQFVTKLEPLPSIQTTNVSTISAVEEPSTSSSMKKEIILRESNSVRSSSKTESPAEKSTKKRRRGRPRKTYDERCNANTPEHLEKNELPPKLKPKPILGSDNMYHCQYCSRSFRKDSQFLRHKCLGSGDYVSSSIKEGSMLPTELSSHQQSNIIVSDDEVEAELDTDVTKDYKLHSSLNHSNNGRKRQKHQQKRVVKETSSSVEGKSEPGTNKSPTSGRAITVFVRAVESNSDNPSDNVVSMDEGKDADVSSFENKPKVNWRKDPDHVPVFSKEEDRLEFEARLNSVNLECVDHLFTRHEVPQRADHTQSKNVSGKESSELSLFLCKVCKKIFKTLSHISLHCLIHTDLKPFVCHQCPYRTNAKGNLYTHMRKHTGNFFHCAHCDFQCCSRSHLFEHEATHSNTRHKCKLCGNDYNTVKSLMNHIRKYHDSPEGKRYLSTFLSKSMKTSAVLHACRVCKHTFKKQIDRDRHLLVHKINDNPNVFHCSLCDYTASRKLYLEAHHKKHRIVYVCSVCCAMFLSSVKLKHHFSEHLPIPLAKETVSVVISQGNLSAALMSQNSIESLPKSICVSGETDILDSKHLDLDSNCSADLNRDESSGVKVLDPLHGSRLKSNSSNCCEVTLRDDLNESSDISNPNFLSVDDFEKSKDGCSLDADFLQQNSNFSVESLQLSQKTDLRAVDSQCDMEQESVSNVDTLDTLFISSINQSWYLPEPDGTLSFSQYLNISEDLVEGVATLKEVTTSNQREDSISEAAKDSSVDNPDQSSRPSAFDIIDALNYKPLTEEVYAKIRKSFGELECDSCGRLFHGRLDLESHKLSHLEEKPFKCDRCSYSATTKEKLKGHQESIHEGKMFPCNKCDFSAHSRTSLWHHQQKHSGKPSCDICDKKFANTRNLREHIVSVHPNIGREQLSKLLGSNRRPIGRLGRRSYKCPYCSKIFHRSNADLQKHIWIHEGIKPYKCDICTYSCRSSNNLKAHKLTHTNDKPYHCVNCEKSFKSRSALKCHKKAHKQNLLSLHGDSKTPSSFVNIVTEEPLSVFDQAPLYTLPSDDQSVFQDECQSKEILNDADPSTLSLLDQQIPSQMYKCLICSCLFKTVLEIKEHLEVQHGMLLLTVKTVIQADELNVKKQSIVPIIAEEESVQNVITVSSATSDIQESMDENMVIHLSPVAGNTNHESILLPSLNVIQKTSQQTCEIPTDLSPSEDYLDKGLSLASETFDVQ